MTTRISYHRDDLLSDEEVREALGPLSDHKWEDVRARIPWSEAVGSRHLRIRWGRLLEWLETKEREVA